MTALDVTAVVTAVAGANARWTAAATPLTGMSPADTAAQRLGVVVDDTALAKLRSVAAPQNLTRLVPQLPPAETAIAPLQAVPSHLQPWWMSTVDWRNRKGRNNVGPVRDQGLCCCCIAFSLTGVLESMVSIEHNVLLQLAPAELVACGGGSCTGWWPDASVHYVRQNGVGLESCFPYVDHQQPCMPCSERNCQAIQATDSVVLFDVAQRKQYLTSVGPMLGVMTVYADLFAYSHGVYSHVWGQVFGAQSLEVVGFDDFAGCWICKNCWGPGWGEQGYLRVAYGECDIDGRFPFWGVSATRWLL